MHATALHREGGVREGSGPAAPPSRVRRGLSDFGPPQLLATTLVLGAAVLSLAPPRDPDVWWHLRSGGFILDHHRLPHVDHWSLVAQGRRWVSHEWLGEVVITAFYRAFGTSGIGVFRSLAVLVLLTAVTVQCFRRTTPYRALACSSLAVLATSGGWGERPQLLSFGLLALAVPLVRSVVDGRRSAWWLLPYTWLWANVHGLWFLMIGLLGVQALGTLWQDGWASGRDRAARTTTVAVGCVAAAALTPNGPGLLLEPLHIHQSAHFVSEWAPPSIRTPYGFGFFALIGLLVAVLSRGHGRVDRRLVLLALFAGVLGASYIRTVAPAAVLLAPVVAQLWQPARPGPVRRGPALLNGLVAAALVVTAVAGGVLVRTRLPALPPGAPVAATRALLGAAPAPQRVIDEYDIGGWLLGRAPSVRPAIDGRIEIFPLDFVNHYLAALAMSGDWRATIDPLHADAALLRPSTPLVNGLRDQEHWREVFRDKTWVVLVPPRTPVP